MLAFVEHLYVILDLNRKIFANTIAIGRNSTQCRKQKSFYQVFFLTKTKAKKDPEKN